MTPVVHLVDNDPRVLKSLARLFEIEGLCTTSNTSAQEFLQNYDATVPGCVVLDMEMPGQSGLDLQAELERNQMMVPLVFLSGRSTRARQRAGDERRRGRFPDQARGRRCPALFRAPRHHPGHGATRACQ